jgi:4-amino-4-deoxy-L-arabinose transferase-like glycosyltransferase
MGDPEPEPTDLGTGLGGHTAGPWSARALPLACILAVATGLRFWNLDASSLWYDEVVTMRVARAEGLAALVERLDRIDGTRAPLHPLVLHAWLRLLGPSDLAGRAFSALCGLATVVVVYLVGRHAYDDRTGLWSAWLTAVCPPLVYYSQEARMYAWLVLLTALSWLTLLSFRHAAGAGRCLLYALLLTALAYSHPLGLFMIAAHGLAYLLTRPALRLTLPRWLMIQIAVVAAVAPWLRRYLDHGTDYPMPRYAIRFLLAVPIEYIGGNSLVLLVCLAIVVVGLVTSSREPFDGRRRLRMDHPVESVILIIWAAAPPVSMYVYSYAGQPIFGPSRYHLFCAPAYLVLVAHGSTRLPPLLRWPLAAAGLVLSISLLTAYSPTLKADWRGLAAWLDRQHPQGATDPVTVLVHPSNPRFPREQLEAARYYLEPRFRVVAAQSASHHGESSQAVTYHVYCLARSHAPHDEGPVRGEFYGLMVKSGG